MKLLVWNIQQGGGHRRIHNIIDRIKGQNADVVAIIEFERSEAGPLWQSLRDRGFQHQIRTIGSGSNHPVSVFSRRPIRTRLSGIPTLDDSGLWLEIGVQTHRFSFGVVHVPTKSPQMRQFLDAVVQVGALRKDEPFLFVGDFNTGLVPADGLMANAGVVRFPALLKTGFTDAWRHFHGETVEYTYTQSGKSYRIDHALASPELLPRIRDCRYSHLEREIGASDHSALLIEIED